MSTPRLKTLRAALCAVAILTAGWCRADEKMSPLNTALSSTVMAGYVSTSVEFNFEPAAQIVPEPSASALLAVFTILLLRAFIVGGKRREIAAPSR